MKSVFFIVFITLYGISALPAQIIGMWIAVDDIDGLEKSIVEIYEKDGKLHGRVDKLLPNATVTHCTGCSGELKNKPLPGLVILNNLTKSAKGGTGGKILDPSTGKWYSCYLELVSPEKLKMRGYLGMPAFGRTQYWYRMNK